MSNPALPWFRRAQVGEALTGYLFIAPNVLGFVLFTTFPVMASFGLAFVHWDILTPWHWAGLENFVSILGAHRDVITGAWAPNDKDFWRFLGNTVYLMIGIPFGMAGALFLAIVLNRAFRGVVFYRTLYFLPSVCGGVGLLLLWRWIYNPEFGLLNNVLRPALAPLGLQPPNWLSSTNWSKPALILMGLWGGMGGPNMILYLAGLQNIPRHLYEAAEMDGASTWQRFTHITLPLLTPTTFFILIMSIIGGFQGGFEAARVMTGGGPAGSTTTIEYYIFQNAFEWFKMGYAAALSWILFVIVFIATLLTWRFGGRRVHYF